MTSLLNALHEQAKEENLESDDSNPGDHLPQTAIADSLGSAFQSTSRFGPEQQLSASGSIKNLANSIGTVGNSRKSKAVNALEDQAKASGLTGIKFGMSSAFKGVQPIKESVLSTTSARIKGTTNDVFKGDSLGIEVVKNSFEESLKDSEKQLKEVKQVMTKELEGSIKITDSIQRQVNNKSKEELKQIGLPGGIGIKDAWPIQGDKLKQQLQQQISVKLEEKVEGIKGLGDKEKDRVAAALVGDNNYQNKPNQMQDAISINIPGNNINKSINSMNLNVKILEPPAENNDNNSNVTNTVFQGLQGSGNKTPTKLNNLSNVGLSQQSPSQILANSYGQKRQQEEYYDEEKQRSSSKFISNQLQKPFDDCNNAIDERMPDEDVARRNSSGNPFILNMPEVPLSNSNFEKNNLNNISFISRMKASEYQSRVDGPVDLNIRQLLQQQQLEMQLSELQSQQVQTNQGQSSQNQYLHQYYQPPSQLQISQPSGLKSQQQFYQQQQVQQQSSYDTQNISYVPNQPTQQLQSNAQRLSQILKTTGNNKNTKDNIPAIQPLELPKVQQLVSKKLLKLLPWLLLALIGLWTIIFMIAQLAYFSSFNLIKQNSQEQVADWYSTNLDLQQPALDTNYGLSQNTITLVDFLIYFVITKVVYAIWLSEDYFGSGVCKDFFVVLFLLKDITVIVLSVTAGSYSNSASGWSNFGFYWLSSFGKLSIIISIQKIIFFRLNYFRLFSQQKAGCTGALRNWGASLYNWASLKQEKFPELVISGIFIGTLYLPLVFHLIVGIIEFTYIVIIWIAILFVLQQLISFAFELCKPKQQEQTLSQRLLANQKQGINDQLEKYWAFFLPLIVLAPSISSASFSDNFEYSIKLYLSGSQLILNYFSIPSGNASYASNLSFICNLLSVF